MNKYIFPSVSSRSPMHDPEDPGPRNPRENPRRPPAGPDDPPHSDDDPQDPRSVPPKEIV